MILAAGDGGPHHIQNVTASHGLGNILSNGGTIGTVRANRDGRNVGGVFEGINGPIRAVQTANVDPVRGNVLSVSIATQSAYGTAVVAEPAG